MIASTKGNPSAAKKQADIRKIKQWAKIGLFVCIVSFVVFRVFAAQPAINSANKTIAELNNIIADETAKSKQLDEEKGLVSTEEYKKKIARERLGLLMPNERIYQDISQK